MTLPEGMAQGFPGASACSKGSRSAMLEWVVKESRELRTSKSPCCPCELQHGAKLRHLGHTIPSTIFDFCVVILNFSLTVFG